MAPRAVVEAAPLRNPPVQRRSQETLARIYAAAGQAFDEVGVDAVSMEEIARRAAVSIGTLYRFYPSKPALVGDIVDRYRRQHESSGAQFFDDASLARPADAVVRDFFRQFLTVVAKQPGWRGLTQAGYLFAAGDGSEEWQARLERFFERQVPGLSRRRRATVAATFQALTGSLLLHAAHSGGALAANLREAESVLLGYVGELRRQTTG
jgi:AcrR family transcriptional regulator